MLLEDYSMFRIESYCRKGYWESLLQKINYAQVMVMLKEYPCVLLMAVVGGSLVYC